MAKIDCLASHAAWIPNIYGFTFLKIRAERIDENFAVAKHPIEGTWSVFSIKWGFSTTTGQPKNKREAVANHTKRIAEKFPDGCTAEKMEAFLKSSLVVEHRTCFERNALECANEAEIFDTKQAILPQLEKLQWWYSNQVRAMNRDNKTELLTRNYA